MKLKPHILTAALILELGVIPALAFAQLPAPQKPFEPKVPQGEPGCRIDKPCAEVAPDIIKSALGASPLENNLRHLTDVIGGRVTGSPAAEKAVDWAVESFRKAGVDEVHTEKFTIPVGWAEGHTQLVLLSPTSFPVHLVSTGWSPAIPAGGITTNVVDVGTGDEAGFARAGPVRGALVLVH